MSTQNPPQPPQPPASGQTDTLLSESRQVALGAPFDWLRLGWHLLKRDLAMWLVIDLVLFGVVLVFILISNSFLVLSPLPQILMTPLIILIAGGLFMGMHESYQGGMLEVGHVFAGFKRYFLPLALIGLVNAVLSLGLYMLFNNFWQGIDPETLVQQTDTAAIEMMLQTLFSPRNLLLGLLYLLLGSLLSMIFWLAAALAVVNHMPSLQAMNIAFQGVLRNILPLTFYSMLSLLINTAGSIALMIGLLITIPWLLCSTYMAYRNLFVR